MYESRSNSIGGFRQWQSRTGVVILISVLGSTLIGLLVVYDQLALALVFPAMLIAVPLLGKPMQILRVVTFMAPIYWLPGVPPDLYQSLRDVLFLAFFASLVINLVVGNIRLQSLPKSAGLKILAVVLLAMSMGVVFSPTPLPSLVHWLRALQAVLFYVGLLLIIQDEDQVKQLLLLFLLGHLLSVGFLWLETIADQFGVVPPWSIPYQHIDRAEVGLSFRRTAFSNTTAHVLPIVIGAMFWVRNPGRKTWYLILALLLSAIVISHGRAGFVAALITLVVMFWGRSKTHAAALLVGIAAFSILFPSVAMAPFINKHAGQWLFGAKTGLQQFDRLTGHRFGNYLYSVELMAHNPLVGVGLGRYRQAVEGIGKNFSFVPYLQIDWNQSSSAHNLYLDIASEAGLLAGLSLVVFVFWSLRRMWKTVHEYDTGDDGIMVLVLSGIVIAQLITSLFEVEIFSTLMRAFPFWISMAALAKLYPVTDGQVKQQTSMVKDAMVLR